MARLLVLEAPQPQGNSAPPRRVNVASRFALASLALLLTLLAGQAVLALAGQPLTGTALAILAVLQGLALLALVVGSLVVHAYAAATPQDRGLAWIGGLTWLLAALAQWARAGLLLTETSSPASAATGLFELASLAAFAVGLAAWLFTLGRLPFLQQRRAWRVTVHGQLVLLALLGGAVAVLVASGEARPLAQLLEAPLATQIFAATTALTAALLGGWVVIALSWMRKQWFAEANG